MKKLTLCCAALLLSAPLLRAQSGIEISLKNNSPREAKTKERLSGLLRRYDLSKWIRTRKVLIEQYVVPHSHPVLTLNTRGDGDELLATFIHEQIHWFEEERAEQRDAAVRELKTVFPKVPAGLPEGAKDEESTYLHLIVNYLEYEAMKELVGAAKAREVLGAKGYYKWIYKTVLTEGEKIKGVVEKHGLTIK